MEAGENKVSLYLSEINLKQDTKNFMDLVDQFHDMFFCESEGRKIIEKIKNIELYQYMQQKYRDYDVELSRLQSNGTGMSEIYRLTRFFEIWNNVKEEFDSRAKDPVLIKKERRKILRKVTIAMKTGVFCYHPKEDSIEIMKNLDTQDKENIELMIKSSIASFQSLAVFYS